MIPRKDTFAIQVLVLTSLRLVINVSMRMVYPFLSVFARAFGVSLASISLALTVRSFAGVLAPILAPVADQHGRKVGMVIGSGLMSLALGLVVFFPVYPAFFVSLSLVFFGLFIYLPAMQAYISDQVVYQKRGKIIAITELAWALSFIVGMPLVALLIERFGWWSPYPILTFLSVLGFIGILILIPNQSGPKAPRQNHYKVMLDILRTPPALAALFMGLFFCVSNESVALVFGVWLEDSFGLKIAALGAASAIMGLAELGGEGLTAWLVDRLGKRFSVRLGLLLNCVFALLLPWIGTSVTGALIGLFLFYISFEFVVVSSLPLVSEVYPQRRATLMGLFLAAFSLGRAFGDLLAPVMYAYSFWMNAGIAVLFNGMALAALYFVRNGAE
jgi:predicted MFS family arabinose efflux permease